MSDDTPATSFSRVEEVDRGSHRRQSRRTGTRAKATLPQTDLPRIFQCRHSSRFDTSYFTSGRGRLGKPSNVLEEPSPFAVVPKSLLFGHLHFRKTVSRVRRIRNDRAKSIPGRSRNPPRPSSKLPRVRLHVEVPLEMGEARVHKELDDATAMTDIDPKYFTELRGRPVKDRSSLRGYVDDAREVLRIRLLAGQERDDCIRIDQQHDKERGRLTSIECEHRRYVYGFDEFLAKDHRESTEVLQRAEEIAKVSLALGDALRELAKQVARVSLELCVLEESWTNAKACRTFLRQIAPRSRRTDHEAGRSAIPTTTTTTTMTMATATATKNADASSYYKNAAEEDTSLESLVENFERDVADAEAEADADGERTAIRFTDPYDMLRVFRAMELQNLNALIHSESLAGPTMTVTSTVAETDARIRREITDIANGINDLERSIVSEEERARHLEDRADRLLRGVFRDLVCSEAVLYLFVCVEDAYEACVAPNHANLDAYSMMRAVERVHETLNMQLDDLPIDIVARCEEACFRKETRRLRDAEDAARKLQLVRRLIASLERIVEPPRIAGRKPMWRSAPVAARSKPRAPPRPQTTEADFLYLTFFADCRERNGGPLDSRSRIPDDFEPILRGANEFGKRSESSGSDPTPRRNHIESVVGRSDGKTLPRTPPDVVVPTRRLS